MAINEGSMHSKRRNTRTGPQLNHANSLPCKQKQQMNGNDSKL